MQPTTMNRPDTPAPGPPSSFEAMIEASVSSAVDRRFGTATNTLNLEVEEAVVASLNRRLGPDGGKLKAQISLSVNATVEQRLGRSTVH